VHRYLAASEAAPRHAVMQLLRHLDNRSSLLIGLVEQMLPRREDWLGLVQELSAGAALPDIRDRLEQARASLVRSQLEGLHQCFPTAALHEAAELAHLRDRALAAAQGGATALHFLHDASVPTAALDQRERWQALAGLLLTQGGQWLKRFAATIGHRAAPLVRDLEREAGLCERLHAIRSLPTERFLGG
jgi:hypothetical protein